MIRRLITRTTLGCALTLIIGAQLLGQEPPRAVVLATRGTIAGTYDEATGALRAALTGEEIVAAVEGLSEIASVSVERVAHVNSRDMTPAIWLDLTARPNALLAEPDVAGIVVTYGTDTLEEIAYSLDLTVAIEKPIVVVGAQRAPTMSDTDGPRNLLNAVCVVVSEEARGMDTTCRQCCREPL